MSWFEDHKNINKRGRGGRGGRGGGGDRGDRGTSSGLSNQSSPAQAPASVTSQVTSQAPQSTAASHPNPAAQPHGASQGPTSTAAPSWSQVASRPSQTSSINPTAATFVPGMPQPAQGPGPNAAPTGPAQSGPRPSMPALPASASTSSAPPANAQPANAPPANAQPANAQPANAQPANVQPANVQPANASNANASTSNAPPANAPPANAGTVPITPPRTTGGAAPTRQPTARPGDPINPLPWKAVASVPSTDYSPHQLVIQTAVDNREADVPLCNTLYSKGLKTDVASIGKSSTVQTNFLAFKERSTTFFIYRVEFVKEYSKDGNPVLFAKKFDRQGLFQALAQQPGCGILLNQRTHWVTDFANIWSTVPLFHHLEYTYVPNNVSDLDGTNPNSNRSIKALDACVVFDRTIDLQKTVGQLFRDSSGRTKGTDDPALLERGLNAVVTKFAQESAQAQTGVIQSGANKFYDSKKGFNLQNGTLNHLRAYHGFFVSVRPGAQTLLLNINLRCSPFLENGINLSTLISQTCKNDKLATSVLKGVKVQVTGSKPANLPHQGVEFVTAVDHRQMPNNVNVGKDARKHPSQASWRSASSLQTAGYSPYRQALSSDQTTKMINQALKQPLQHITDIKDAVFPMLGLNDDGFKAYLRVRFGIVIDTELQNVPCRFLKEPKLWYGSKNPSNAHYKNASWNLQDVKLHEVGQTSNINVIDFSGLPDQGRAGSQVSNLFTEALRRALNQLGHGASVSPVNFQHLSTLFQNLIRDGNNLPSENEMVAELCKAALKQNASIVIIPRRTFDLYSTIRRAADIHLGIQVTCAASDKLGKFGEKGPTSSFSGRVMFCSNIVLKLNLKGNGTNHKVDRTHFRELYQSANPASININDLDKAKCDTIVIGADVTHPMGLCAPGCPSVAAVVGSVNDDFTKFPGSMRLQRGRQEVIFQLADMVMERLIDWAEMHGDRLPNSMLFYRDGVSESQFDDIRKLEIPCLQEAYDKADGYLREKRNEKPVKNRLYPFKLTFVVVGKRHNTRFFPTKKEDIIFPGKNDNVKPGLVVDQVITHPYIMDFYLQSHLPIKGTGKSAHYFVLQNNMTLSSDRLQEITHAFCYNYARATKGVSYCGPAYYADRLCDRGRMYIRDWLVGRQGFGPSREPITGEEPKAYLGFVADELHNDTYYRPVANRTQQYGRERQNPWHPNLDGVMFYL